MQHCGKQFGEAVDELLVEMPDHAVVDKADHVLRQDKDIAGVGVPMKQAVYQNLLKDGVGAVRGDSLKVVAVIAQSVEVRHLDAVHIFQGQTVVAWKKFSRNRSMVCRSRLKFISLSMVRRNSFTKARGLKIVALSRWRSTR